MINPVIRGLAIYLFLLLLFRFTGKRSLAETNTFDFILLLIISEATQQGMLGEDFSVTNAFLLIATLIAADILLTKLKVWFPVFENVAEGMPLLLMAEGTIYHDRLKKVDMEIDDILEAARSQYGLYQLKQIKYAVLEKSGSISIIPKPSAITAP